MVENLRAVDKDMTKLLNCNVKRGVLSFNKNASQGNEVLAFRYSRIRDDRVVEKGQTRKSQCWKSNVITNTMTNNVE